TPKWYFVALCKFGGVTRLQFCDYHNMVAILEKSEHNVDFHLIVDFVEASPLRHYTRRARIAQSSALPPVADEPASPLRDVSQGEACPTGSSLDVEQDMANIAKTSTLPHDSAPGVTSPAADEGSMQQTTDELTALCTSLQRQHSEMVARFEAQALEIESLKARIQVLEDKDRGVAEQSGDDAPIKRMRLDVGEEAAERVSNDTEEMAIVLTFMNAATILASGVAEVPTGSGFIPTAGPPPVEIARDAEIARIHTEEELQIMIDGLDRSNETVAKYLQEYHQFASELHIERRIELISDLVRYQDNYAKVHKYQTQQRKPWSKKQKRDYYMAVIKSNLGWKVKDFRGMTFEEIEAKFTTVWKQIKNFIPMGSKEEAERSKRKRIRFEQENVKKLKTSEEVPEEVKTPDEVPEEKVKKMMQLVPIEEITRLGGSSASYQFFVDMLKHLDREDLNQLWALVKESLSIRPPISDKEIELWVELKRLYEPDDEDQLWTHTQNLMHALVEWKLYDTCGVHHVTSKDKEIFMLVEKDYPLMKGLDIGMISYKLQVENYSKMANDLILKIYKIASSPRHQVSVEFDAYGFSIKDYQTQKILLHCDSTGDLYPVTQQPPLQTPVVLLSFSSTTWHRLLGHPGDDVLRPLESSNLISCNKSKLPALCHACQLGKHVKLSFNNSTSSVKSVFEITHSDIWTSPIPSESDEYNALITNGTWVLVPRPANVNVVRSMWIFKHKFHADGSLSRYKVRLVANGHNQQQGIDCDETFSLVVKPATIRTVLSLAISRDWPVHQLDRSLYGLKQAPRAWFQRFASFVTRIGFQHSKTDTSLFVFHHGSDIAYLLLYVDGIILTTSSTALLQRIIALLYSEFAMTDLGSLHYFLGVSAQRSSSGMFLSQSKFAEEFLSELMCRIITRARPLLILNLNLHVCLYMQDPRDPHFTTLKRILCYVRGTLDYGLQLYVSSTTQLTAYTDADWAGCPVTRRSTSGYCVFLGDNLLSWSAKRQVTLSRFSVEAEYRGVANVVTETAWIRNLLCELHTPLFTATHVYCDNVSAVYMSANPVQHQRTKNIEIDIHFVRDFVAKGEVRVLHMPSRFQYDDIFTKGIPAALFLEFRSSLNVRRPSVSTAEEY
nr:ribonuclease H-like domain-containing protein [Tanacetum cinerariifolium]